MKILSIETSCDETAVSIVEAIGNFPHASYRVLGNALYSQVLIHREYGGVFPNVAKREHAKTLVPMLTRALQEADLLFREKHDLSREEHEITAETLQREPELKDMITAFLEQYTKPDIDLIAVTSGPGLEPTLWVGINFARTLSYIWNIKVVPVDHMEGHILASVFDGKTIPELSFPALALLISGGHTELVRMKDWKMYEVVGQTRDDAVGEAFDKAARMLDLPYPGGPEISKLAETAREKGLPKDISLPRPMRDSDDLDLSFSGLKTAVLHVTQDRDLDENDKATIAREFEDAVAEVLLKKAATAVETYKIQTLILGGGVSANAHIRKTFSEYFKQEYPELTLYTPDPKLTTDNSIMIALAGHAQSVRALNPQSVSLIKADGNRSLAT